jgi:hypothetical protein
MKVRLIRSTRGVQNVDWQGYWIYFLGSRYAIASCGIYIKVEIFGVGIGEHRWDVKRTRDHQQRDSEWSRDKHRSFGLWKRMCKEVQKIHKNMTSSIEL